MLSQWTTPFSNAPIRAALGMLVVACLPSCAQIFSGSISATVLDPSGAAVPEAVAKLRAVKTGIARLAR